MILRTVAEIDRDVRVARREVFSDNDAIANEASFRIGILLSELASHPEEQKRRADLKTSRDERLLFRWQ